MVKAVVLYGPPEDPDVFERYYAETHTSPTGAHRRRGGTAVAGWPANASAVSQRRRRW
jgi:hypothetical protein